MAVEKDVVNVRSIIVSTLISSIVVLVTVWLVSGWFDRYAGEQVIRDAEFDKSTAQQLEREQKATLTTKSGGPEWVDKKARKARLPLGAAMDLAVKTEEERRNK